MNLGLLHKLILCTAFLSYLMTARICIKYVSDQNSINRSEELQSQPNRLASGQVGGDHYRQLFDIDVTNYSGPARPFSRWSGPFPCFPETENLMATDPAERGFLFQRPYKTGSTTLAGMVMRIAQRQAQRHLKHPPFIDSVHNKSLFANIAPITAVRFTTIYQREPTDFNFVSSIEKVLRNDLLQDLSLYPLNETNSSLDYSQVVDDILQAYNFIALLERFDESMVALKMLLDLDFEDILYVRERSEGTFSNGPDNRPCIRIHSSFVTPGMQDYFLSDAWMDRIEGDVMLYRAVHMSLDRTIDLLGREEFQRQLAFFRRVNHRAQDLCASRSVGMCSAGGMPIPEENRTCYIWNEGCSHACLDEIKISDPFKRVVA